MFKEKLGDDTLRRNESMGLWIRMSLVMTTGAKRNANRNEDIKLRRNGAKDRSEQ